MWMKKSYCLASTAQRLCSSSLYLVAALLVYFVLGSLLARAAEPPWVWKYFVALSLPPTFMMRSWSHCQTRIHQHMLYPKASRCSHKTYCPSSLTAQRRCEHPCSCGSPSNRGRGKCRTEQNSMLGSLRRNRNISVHIHELCCPQVDRNFPWTWAE